MPNEFYGSGTTPKTSDTLRMLLVKTLQSTNLGGGGGGGGGGTTNGITYGNYGGGQPSFIPVTGNAYAIDTSNLRPWIYANGAWN